MKRDLPIPDEPDNLENGHKKLVQDAIDLIVGRQPRYLWLLRILMRLS